MPKGKRVVTQSQSEEVVDQGTPPVEPKSLSLIAQEHFGDHFHGEVEEPPKTPPELPEGEEDDDIGGGEKNTKVEGDEIEDEGEAPPQEPAAAEAEAPIATVRELVDYLEADPAWFDDLKVDVTVNGNPSQVPLKSVIENYRMNQAADERLEQAKSKSAQAQQEAAERNAAIDLEYEKAAKLVLMGEQELNDEVAKIDWDGLKRDDPAMWSAERVRIGEKAQRIQHAKAQVAYDYQARKAQEYQEQQNRKATIQAEQIQLLAEAMPKVSPEWGDAQKVEPAKGRLMTYLLGQGISQKEIEETFNHRAFVIAEKARLWDESQSKLAVTKKRIQTVPKVMKPGARQDVSTVNMERVKNARARLRSTGRIDDAFALLRAEQNRR